MRPNLYHPAWLLVFAVAGLVLSLGQVPLFDVDEGAFAEATREMLDSGVWSATYLDGEPRYDKPILTYWVQALMASLFGFDEAALRLHSVLSALLWGAALYGFCRQFVDRRTAIAAGLLFCSTLGISLIGRAATADALLNLWIALTLFDSYRFARSGASRHLHRSWLWLSLGVLTKGPVAIAIPLLTTGIWFISLGRFRQWLKAVLSPAGWLILTLVLAPWLWFVWQEQGAGFFRGFLLEHNLERFSSTREGHGGHWYYYLLVLPLVLLPYSGMLAGLARHLRALWRRPFERLLLLWFAVVFVLVSLSQTQLPHYVLYGVTPLIVLFAKYRRLWCRGRGHWILPLAFALLQVALVVLSHRLAGWQPDAYRRDMLAAAPEVFDGVYLAAALLMLLALLLLASLRAARWQSLALAGLLQGLFTFLLLVPAVATLQQAPVKQAALVACDLGQPVIAYRIHMPSFSLYRGAETPSRPARPGDSLLTRSDRLPDLQQRFGADAITIHFHRGGIVLASIAPAAFTLERQHAPESKAVPAATGSPGDAGS